MQSNGDASSKLLFLVLYLNYRCVIDMKEILQWISKLIEIQTQTAHNASSKNRYALQRIILILNERWHLGFLAHSSLCARSSYRLVPPNAIHSLSLILPPLVCPCKCSFTIRFPNTQWTILSTSHSSFLFILKCMFVVVLWLSSCFSNCCWMKIKMLQNVKKTCYNADWWKIVKW